MGDKKHLQQYQLFFAAVICIIVGIQSIRRNYHHVLQDTDKLLPKGVSSTHSHCKTLTNYYIKVFLVHIATDCIGRCKLNFHDNPYRSAKKMVVQNQI